MPRIKSTVIKNGNRVTAGTKVGNQVTSVVEKQPTISATRTVVGNFGTLLFAHASRHLSGGPDELDGDRVDVDFVPANYVNADNELASHLAGIDAALITAGVGPTQDYVFSHTFRVPAQGRLYLMYGNVPTSSVPFVAPVDLVLEAASIRVNQVDPGNTYNLEIVVNGSVAETLALVSGAIEAATTSFVTMLSAGDDVAVRLTRTGGSDKSTFRRISATLIARET